MPDRPAIWSAVIAALLFVLLLSLGFWQLGRHQAQAKRLEEVAARQLLPPVDNTMLRASPNELVWQRALLSGSWHEAPAVLVAARFEHGRSGYDLISLLALDGGGHILVDRGWIDVEGYLDALEASPLPPGPVTIGGLLMPLEGDPTLTAIPVAPELPDRWRHPASAAIARAAPTPVLPVLLVAGKTMAKRDPRQDPLTGYDATPHQIGHLAYAVQWFSTALLWLAFWIALAVRGRRAKRSV